MNDFIKRKLEEFDKRFTRINKSTGKFEEKWFVKEYITAKEIKDFIESALKESLTKI